MKKLIALALLLCSQSVFAKPYFRWEPFKQMSTGGFFKIGDPKDKVRVGSITSLIVHKAEDGYFLLPGVSWDLVDLGWTFPTNGGAGSVVVGPSIKLNEPVKAVVRHALALSNLHRGFVRELLAPGDEGWALSVGPSFGLSFGQGPVKGGFLMQAGLSRKFE